MFTNFFTKNFVLFGIMWKNMIQTDRPQITIKYGAMASYAGYLRLQTHTQHCNTYCFSTATMVVRTRLNVTLYVRTLYVFFFSGRCLYTGK